MLVFCQWYWRIRFFSSSSCFILASLAAFVAWIASAWSRFYREVRTSRFVLWFVAFYFIGYFHFHFNFIKSEIHIMVSCENISFLFVELKFIHIHVANCDSFDSTRTFCIRQSNLMLKVSSSTKSIKILRILWKRSSGKAGKVGSTRSCGPELKQTIIKKNVFDLK